MFNSKSEMRRVNEMMGHSSNILRNRCKCAKCGDIIESKHRHDWVQCKCGAISTDGGTEYLHRGAKDFKDIIDMTEWRVPPSNVPKPEKKEVMMTKQLVEYLPEIFKLMEEQLTEDQKRWGDTWMKRPYEGSDSRVIARFKDYIDQFEMAGTPLPYKKIIGECIIQLVRQLHPEVRPDGESESK